MNISPIPALQDNYIWCITHDNRPEAIIVDPGEAAPVLAKLSQDALKLTAILITHHHWDHTNGIKALLQQYDVPVYAPAYEKISQCTHPLEDGDQVAWPELGIEFNIITVPGHTRGHIAYMGHNSLFCGDTLFAGGCGKLFEGTAKQLYDSLCRITHLNDSTEIYCAHEYTADNLRFAQTVEPDNAALAQRIEKTAHLRQQHLPTLPSSLAVEKQTNPFLRCHLEPVSSAVSHYLGHKIVEPAEVFAALRQWKDNFRKSA